MNPITKICLAATIVLCFQQTECGVGKEPHQKPQSHRDSQQQRRPRRASRWSDEPDDFNILRLRADAIALKKRITKQDETPSSSSEKPDVYSLALQELRRDIPDFGINHLNRIVGQCDKMLRKAD